MEYVYMLKKMWQYSPGRHLQIILFFVFHIVSMIGLLMQPFIFSEIINKIQIMNKNSLIKDIAFLIFLYFVCFLIFEIFHRLARRLERYCAFYIKKNFVLLMYDTLLDFPLEWHNTNHSGSTIDKINKAADSLYSFTESQMVFITAFMNFWIPLIILSKISPYIILAATLVGLISVRITKKLYEVIVPEYRSFNETMHKSAATLHDYITNITTIITLKLGNLVRKDLENKMDKGFPFLKREHLYTQIKCFVNALLVVLLITSTLFIYIYTQFNSKHIIFAGTVSLMFSYLLTYMKTFDFYAGEYEAAIHWKTDFLAVENIIANSQQVVLSQNENIRIEKDFNYSVVIDKYRVDSGKFQLENIKIQIKRGQKIAFIGESGSGKSTTLKIIRGLINVEQGKILDKHNKKYNIDALKNYSTLIPQEAEIFENSLLYNITLGIEIESEMLENIIKMSNLDKIIKRLPNGINSKINEKGVNLSGGEKQRLALARGLFAARNNSPLLLLDEPTGSLDMKTELSVYQNIFESFNNKTIISVLHRLHLLPLFDYIYVFSDGQIIEEGTYDELLKNGNFLKKNIITLE